MLFMHGGLSAECDLKGHALLSIVTKQGEQACQHSAHKLQRVYVCVCVWGGGGCSYSNPKFQFSCPVSRELLSVP
jgi:hypothetical protein